LKPDNQLFRPVLRGYDFVASDLCPSKSAGIENGKPMVRILSLREYAKPDHDTIVYMGIQDLMAGRSGAGERGQSPMFPDFTELGKLVTAPGIIRYFKGKNRVDGQAFEMAALTDILDRFLPFWVRRKRRSL
jgi:hypothetical protein